MNKGVIATQTNEPNTEVKAIVARLFSTGSHIDIALPETLEAQKQWALERYDEHLQTGLQLGYVLTVINAQMETGEFTGWLAANGIKKSSAYNYMKVAKFLQRVNQNSNALEKSTESNGKFSNALEKSTESNGKIPDSGIFENPHLDPDVEDQIEIDEVLAKIIKLPLRKQLVLAQEHPERIREYMRSDLFDEIDKMSLTEIRAVIRQQKEIDKLREKEANATHYLYLKNEELKDLKKLPSEHRQMGLLRKQILFDCELISGAMQRLRKCFEEVKGFHREHEYDAKNVVAYPALLQLDAIVGNAYNIGRMYRERFDIDPLWPISPPKEFTADEAQMFQEGVRALNKFSSDFAHALKTLEDEIKDERKQGKK